MLTALTWLSSVVVVVAGDGIFEGETPKDAGNGAKGLYKLTHGPMASPFGDVKGMGLDDEGNIVNIAARRGLNMEIPDSWETFEDWHREIIEDQWDEICSSLKQNMFLNAHNRKKRETCPMKTCTAKDIEAESTAKRGATRIGLNYRELLWPDNTLPYFIHSTGEGVTQKLIEGSLKMLSDRTNNCVKFKRLTTEPTTSDYVKVVNDEGCYSYVGRTQHVKTNGIIERIYGQSLSLGTGCASVATVQHEFLHALGFHHTQNRADRDEYVTIYPEMINGSQCHNFKKCADCTADKNVPYNSKSIMHYWGHAFACVPSAVTMTAKNGATIPEPTELQQSDIDGLMNVYGCPSVQAETTTAEPTTTTTAEPTTTKHDGILDEYEYNFEFEIDVSTACSNEWTWESPFEWK